MERVIKIGTRGSKLALWQADYVADLLEQNGMKSEIVIIETKGDKILDRSLSKIGSKGVFTEELEEQLRTGGIDIAVHSAKDMQATLPEGFKIIAFTEREQVNDVIVSLKADVDLNTGNEIVLGTSSVRRVAMLKHYYPHVKLVDMRGNLQTRMSKLERGDCDALVLAYAGVHRMNYEEYIVQHLPTDKFTPATGQGSVAIEVSENLDTTVAEAIRKAINHTETEYRLLAERSFLHTLQGGCSIPAFALATLDGDQLAISGGLVRLDGTEVIRKNVVGSKEDAEKLGHEVAQWILDNGGKELLAEIKQQK